MGFDREHRVPLYCPPTVCERRQQTRLLRVAADLPERSESRGGHIFLSMGHRLREMRQAAVASDLTEGRVDANQILGVFGALSRAKQGVFDILTNGVSECTNRRMPHRPPVVTRHLHDQWIDNKRRGRPRQGV
jgi:hypothetical protein